MKKEMLTVIERRVKNSVKFSEDQKKWPGRHILLISNELFIVTEEEEEKGTGDGRFCVWEGTKHSCLIACVFSF